MPAPIGARDGIPVALDLSQRGEEFRCNNACRMLLEKRPVTLPGRRGTLYQGPTDRSEELTRLPYNLIDQVEREKSGDPENAPPDDGFFPVEPGETSGLSPDISNAAIDSSRHVNRSNL